MDIVKNKALCEQYMGKFPVVFVSLKGINGETYETAREMAAYMIQGEARRLQYLLDSERLSSYDKEAFSRLLGEEMGEALLCGSLKLLSELLHKHYGQKVIILIDEYDVPLAKAFERGYYERMLILVQNLFGQALKTNDDMHFAVLTGCMRISKESIFTGLNNLKVLSITDVRFSEFFGFTDREVREMLDYYGLSGQYPVIKEWYDGYRFGKREVYCPWDVVCYCDQLLSDPQAKPQNYWVNTSSNDAVRRFIEKADKGLTRREVERLVAGEALNSFCEALQSGDAKSVEGALGSYLKKTISIRDNFVQHPMKERFYHGILLGILGFKDGWSVYSNKESGDGYSDILVETDDEETGIVLEVKYARDGDLETACREALKQICEKQYEEFLRDEGLEQI